MQIKQIAPELMTASEKLSLLELFRGFYSTYMDWQHLRRRIGGRKCRLLYDEETLVACALTDAGRGCLDNALILTELVYLWEYNQESQIHRMLRTVAETAGPHYSYLLLDVSREHELNLECYRRFGFRNSILPSPKGGENMVLLMQLPQPQGREVPKEP